MYLESNTSSLAAQRMWTENCSLPRILTLGFFDQLLEGGVEGFGAGAEIGLAEFVQRCGHRVQVRVQVLRVVLEVEQPRHHFAFGGMGLSYLIGAVNQQDLQSMLITPPQPDQQNMVTLYFNSNPSGTLVGDGVHLVAHRSRDRLALPIRPADPTPHPTRGQ